MAPDRIAFAATSTVEGRTLKGLAHAFGYRTKVGSHWVEFSRTAFDEALKTSDVRAFVGHDTTRLLGRQSAGTVRLEATQEGLAYEIDLPDTTDGNDTKVLIERGDLSDMSFAIMPGRFTKGRAPDGAQVHTYQGVAALLDISPVSIPAFQGTSIQLHSLNLSEESPRSQLIKRRQRRVIKEHTIV